MPDFVKLDRPALLTFHELDVDMELPFLDSSTARIEFKQSSVAFFQEVFLEIHPACVAETTVEHLVADRCIFICGHALDILEMDQTDI